MGSEFRTLTASFHESNMDEFKRFNPDFNAQKPRFFEEIAYFYCSGIFTGFGIEDLEQSPIIRKWLEKEVDYGSDQRISTRRWLSYLSNHQANYDASALEQPIKMDKKWQKQIIRELSLALWDLVKNGVDCLGDEQINKNQYDWYRSPDLPIDPRFTNLSKIPTHELLNISSTLAELDEVFNYLLSQFVSQHDFTSFPENQMGTLTALRERYDFNSICHLFSDLKVKKFKSGQPCDIRDLFFVN